MMHKALFLDRDGIINIDYGYVSTIENFTFSKDIFALLHLFQKQGYLLFIITNQSGIGRGYYSEQAFETLTQWMLREFQKQGITIASVQYCPHTPDMSCKCRKPHTGMIDTILQKYTIDLAHSWLIGDKQSDIDLAHNASIGHTIAIGSHPIQKSEYIFQTITECTHFLEENHDIMQL